MECEDDGDSIAEQPRAAPVPLLPQQRVRNLVDGFLSPLMSCVQPSLQACVAPASEWKPGTTSRYQCGPYPMPNSGRSSILNYRSSSLGSSSRILESPSIISSAGGSELRPATTTVRTSPNENDVLCGRGNNSNRHPGNQHFRDLVAANKENYGMLTKKEKMLLARLIVDLILNHTDPPARFLGRDTATGLWFDIGIPRSLEKTSQALREKSAATKAAEKACASTTICSVASFDGSISEVISSGDGIEVMSSEGVEEEGAPFSRASTPKITNNHRSGPVEPPPVTIPNHLRKVFSHPPPPPPSVPTKYPQQNINLSADQPHHYPAQHRLGVPSPQQQQQLPPILPAFRPPQPRPQYPHENHHHLGDEVRHHTYPPPIETPTTRNPHVQHPPPYANPGPPPPTIMPSPPRRSVQPNSYHPPPSGSAIVTPQGQYQYHDQQRNGSSYSSPSPRHASSHVMPNHESPIFPVDAVPNPAYGSDARHVSEKTTIASGFGFRERSHINHSPLAANNNNKNVSPTREQKPKRQRMSEHDLNTSTDTFTELNTSWESNGSHSSSAGLTKAIETQLTLEDRTIRSPSGLTQSLGGGRRSQQPLLRPLKVTSSSLDISADSMDGLAALSTAAFLRLDESF